MSFNYPRKIRLADITVRDGFQHEEKIIPTQAKLWCLEQSILAGFKRLEVTNMGNPRGMPQFADADGLLKGIRQSRRVKDLLGDVDAPEMVLDVSWDPESGWSGLSPVEAPNEAPAEESKPRPRDEDLIEDEADSWESMMADQTSRRRPALSSASARPSSQAAFDALLHGRRGTSATDGEAPSPKRVRPAVTTVRPLRPWQDAPRMRTPYDRATPPRPDELDASPDIQEPRSAGDVHNLVVEVLQERDDSPEPSPKSNGVVEIARYLRSRVAR